MSARLEQLEVENWSLRGDLAQYEAALNRAHELIHRMQHILECHKDEVTWGALDSDGTLKDRRLDILTRARKETLEEVITEAKEFYRTAPKPEEWPDLIAERE
jgi:hypothetical protein